MVFLPSLMNNYMLTGVLNSEPVSRIEVLYCTLECYSIVLFVVRADLRQSLDDY